MLQKANYQENGGSVKAHLFTDEATKRKIRRHIHDINDVITEKDIKNAKIPGLDEPPAPLPPTSEKKKKNKKKHQKQVVDDTPGNPVTPWDILNE